MIGSWVAALPPLLVAAALLIVPGYSAARIVGLRGLMAWAIAVPASLTVIVLAALVAPWIGLAWSIIPVALVSAIVFLIAAAVRWLFRAHMYRPANRDASRWIVVAVVLGGLIIAVHLVLVVGTPQNFSQTFDNVFHLNAARYALDTQNASPLHLGGMTSPSGGVWFYPSGWHATVALVVQVTGASIPLAMNAVMIAAASLAWPAGVVLLAVTLFGRSPALILATGVLAAASPAFPLLMVDYGVLYPYFLSVCVLPAVLGFTLRALSLSEDRKDPLPAVILLIVGSLPGLTIAHPGGFIAWLVASSIAALVSWALLLRSRPGPRAIAWATSSLLVFYAAAFALWRFLRPPVEARGWPTTQTVGQAIGEVATMALHGSAIALVLAVFLWIGIGSALRRRSPVSLYAVGLFVVFGMLYVAASAFPWQQLRDLLTAAWYNNAPRLAALIPLIAIPLAGLGAAVAYRWMAARLADRRATARLGASLAVVSVLVLVVTTQGTSIRNEIIGANAVYQITPTAPLVSSDEFALLERLSDEVPPGAVIAGNPWTGAGLAYALADRPVVMPHLLMDVSDAMTTINDELNKAATTPAVCDAVRELGVEYVLDFGGREVHGAEHPFPGLERLNTSGAGRIVDSVGTARLYEVTACG